MKLIYTLFFFLIINIGFSQNYWVSALSEENWDEGRGSIKTSDGGVIAVGSKEDQGTHVLKYNSQGEIEWRKSFPLENKSSLVSGSDVVEGVDAYFISETAFDQFYDANILKIDFNGALIERFKTEGQNINGLMIDREGNLLAIYNEPLSSNTNTLKKLDQDFNLIWETNVSFGKFPLYDEHAYLDEDNQLELWLNDANDNDNTIRALIDSNGNIIEQDTFPSFQTSVDGVLHGKLSDSKAVYVAGGGNINGTVRTLTLIDLESEELLQQKQLSLFFYWIKDLTIFNNKIYILGRIKDEDGLWNEILILDSSLDIVDKISLKELIPEDTDDLRGISAQELSIDESGNLIITGMMLGSNPNFTLPNSKGYLNMFLDPEGKLDNVLSLEFEDFTALDLYPNPCHDKLFIDGEFDEELSLEVYNNLGQKLMSYNTVKFPFELNTGELQAGQYFMVIGKEEERLMQSFIKQ